MRMNGLQLNVMIQNSKQKHKYILYDCLHKVQNQARLIYDVRNHNSSSLGGGEWVVTGKAHKGDCLGG